MSLVEDFHMRTMREGMVEVGGVDASGVEEEWELFQGQGGESASSKGCFGV